MYKMWRSEKRKVAATDTQFSVMKEEVSLQVLGEQGNQ